MKSILQNRLNVLFVTILLSFTVFSVLGQSPRELYSQAQNSFENGKISSCLTSLQNCQIILGGSNARIELLRTQCYIVINDWTRAKIALRNFLNLVTPSDKLNDKWQAVLDLEEEINLKLDSEEKLFKQKIENQKLESLRSVEDELSIRTSTKLTKLTKLNTKNDREIFNYAIKSKDKNALTFYKEATGTIAESSHIKTVNHELDKHKYPSKYLLDAVLVQNVIEAKYLIEIGGNKNLKDINGNSLIHHAVNTNNIKMLQMLKEQGADLDLKNSNDESALMLALKLDKFAIFSSLLELGAKVKDDSKNSMGALHYSLIYSKSIKTTEMILRKGVDITKYFSVNDTLMSPLYYAVYYKKSIPLVQILLESGAPINDGKKDWSPLMAAVLTHNIDLVTELIKHNANVNLTGIHNWTALHFASRENQPKIVEVLLKSGADIKIKDEWGRTARKVAKENNCKDAFKLLK